MTKEKGNIFSNIKERILQIGDYYEVGRKNICELIGMTYGNFTGKAKDTPINSIAIQNIIVNYPMIDANWLLTGQGPMLRTKASEDPVPSTSLSPNDAIITLLKEQLKEERLNVEKQAQEIGVLKSDNRQLREQVMGLDQQILKLSISLSKFQSTAGDAPSVPAPL